MASLAKTAALDKPNLAEDWTAVLSRRGKQKRNSHKGRRQALRPMMFFMAHCDAELYENLLEANWMQDLLSNMTLFGNIFEAYEQHVSECKNIRLTDSRKHILAIRQFVKELPMDSMKHIIAIRQFAKERSIDPFSDDLFCVFHGSSSHFFDIDPHSDLCDAKL
ncbi:hypothetical protein RDI58_019855 [Solanum bulbocastanum]|uniref:SRR1-like domain-containing protein n=1 Tax=Solanum bulbocastanum TaxID=147425 RepID=A0AAN8T8W7_SOLBU